MSTQSPTPPPPSGYGAQYGPGIPPIPVPNPELAVYVLSLVVVGIVALATDDVVAPFWVEFAKWATAAYLVSRGIAKLGKVFENR